jgi:hypothetical protein
MNLGERFRESGAAWYVFAGVLITVAVLAATAWPIAIVVIVALIVFLVVAAKKPQAIASLLVVAAIPFMRPNLFGEQVALVGTGLCVAGALVALAADKGHTRIPKQYVVIIMGVLAMSTWLLTKTSIFGDGNPQFIFQGYITTGLTVLAAGVVLAGRERRQIVGRGFVWLVLAVCASYAVTVLYWLVMGIGSGAIATFAISSEINSAVLYFPLTPTSATQTVQGVTFPRLTGIGREPGWMAIYAGIALLLWPRVGKPKLLGRAILVLGLLGTISTAGFGVFAVVLILTWIANPSPMGDAFTRLVGFTFKVGFLAVAAWVAYNAPVLGFSAKGGLNEVSLTERSNATAVGLEALTASPLGGVHSGVQDSINLVASLAPNGLPFFLIVTAIFLLPLASRRIRAGAFGPLMMIYLTLLLSQPANDSTFVFILAGLACVLSIPHAKPEEIQSVELHESGAATVDVGSRAGS